jgi:hypothetical protein
LKKKKFFEKIKKPHYQTSHPYICAYYNKRINSGQAFFAFQRLPRKPGYIILDPRPGTNARPQFRLDCGERGFSIKT